MLDPSLDKSREVLNSSLTFATKAKTSGIQSLEKLTSQHENLQTAEDTIEANEYNLQKAMTVLRGMTWTGMVYNMFAKESNPSDVFGRQDGSDITGRTDVEVQHEAKYARNILFTANKKATTELSEEEMLGKLLSSVTDLCDIGVQMGTHIEHQNDIIDRIEEKTVRVTDQTLAVTLKTSQLTQRINNSNDGLIGTYQFVIEGSSCFLSVSNTDLILVPTEDLSTLFFCYLKEATIYGIQNAKTLKFLCSTVWGPIMAVGDAFGRREECHMSLADDETGIYFLQTNWGTGGWLKNPEPCDMSKVKGAVLKSVTSNISDKQGILLLKPVLVSGPENGMRGLCPTL